MVFLMSHSVYALRPHVTFFLDFLQKEGIFGNPLSVILYSRIKMFFQHSKILMGAE